MNSSQQLPKMKRTIILLAILSLFGCSKSLEISEYRIEFKNAGGGIGSTSVEGQVIDEMVYLDFDIRNYKNCNSVRFISNLERGDINSTAYIALFNITDSTAISNSALSTASADPVWLESENIYDELPRKPIDLAIRLRTEIGGGAAYCSSAYLYLGID